ncbi:gamma-taxilin isoform X2 [Maniola jurtina]|uniref:gamma-taxilin isoform X2 n=1 Tax=Maniola jurtina TaxID=191418 RepID=UPI001E6884A8|nr:gamma-taxilin isoform X2 [Maniola jurtina]
MEATAEEVPKESSENVLPENSVEEKTPTPPPQEPTKKSKKDDRSKKDDKNVEQFMKSLNSVPTLDEKLSLVCKKYVQMGEDNKKLHFYMKQSDKRYALLVKEKEQLQHEYNKTVLVKSKLENLCRELQKQNKAIKEESLLKIREEEERRKETQAKFQNTLSEITVLLQQNNEKNAKLRDDNISMTEKFKSVVQQYQLREQQVEKMAKQMTLESQLSDAKLQKAALEHQAEKERLLSDLETLKMNLAQYRAKNMELQGNESGLRSQLAVYTDKYDEFQNALVKSNQVFGGFKEQMEKMSKKIQKLEKESLSWKKRWETSQTALLDMCGERQASEERAAAAARHLQQMQSLCRTLQAERTVLLNSLKEHNIERPPLPTPPPAPAPTAAPAPASNSNVDAMAANCVQLRQSLAHLQSQLNVLTNKKEESPKPEKQKKSKSKKNKSDKKMIQEKEAEATVKDSSEESQPNADENKEQTEVIKEEKIDSKTMESLIQAISMANINLSDLGDTNEIENNDKQNDENEKNDKLNLDIEKNDVTEKTDVTEELTKDSTEINETVINTSTDKELKLETLKDEKLVTESPKDIIDVTLIDNTVEKETKDNVETVCNVDKSTEVITKNVELILENNLVDQIVDSNTKVDVVSPAVDIKTKVNAVNPFLNFITKVDTLNSVLDSKTKVDAASPVLNIESKVDGVSQIVDVKSKDQPNPLSIENKVNVEVLNIDTGIILDGDKKVDEKPVSAEN